MSLITCPQSASHVLIGTINLDKLYIILAECLQVKKNPISNKDKSIPENEYCTIYNMH